MFEGFTVEDVQVDRARLHVRHGGEGPPVLLLHGHPRTGATWHKVAPRLVEAGFTVVCPDLTGYGASPLQMVARHFVKVARRKGYLTRTRALQWIALAKNSCATNRHGSLDGLR